MDSLKAELLLPEYKIKGTQADTGRMELLLKLGQAFSYYNLDSAELLINEGISIAKRLRINTKIAEG